ncbi:diacylglycerol kinase family protein [Stieleria varia]|uniref:Undecaprenol kinase n=1 Tax=Stieleria varia TaxID=2528005 RepID=A0A5C6B8D4_9BACT|nr:diacylglycerol kinase family protein [Stieleria varia]TWU08220.1 Undecaprenol kinase [Stieleria varia]
MNDTPPRSAIKRWISKFAVAIAGTLWAFRTQNSFYVHLLITIAVVGLGLSLQLDRVSLCLLILSIAIVLAAELFNTAIELLIAALHPERDAKIGRALDTAAGAVLITAIGAAIVGMIILIPPLLALLD